MSRVTGRFARVEPAAAGLLPTPSLTHAVLSALTRLDPGTGVDQLAFAARLAAADPEAAALAAFLTRAASGQP
ncbi:hypothetical protein ACIOC1_15155 [Streptomyces sp. NPDC088197]|uniref:hypothetical protein n=1 Tax=unclassified Streptomyces TaxID=2593676 RepID=UPI0037FE7C80